MKNLLTQEETKEKNKKINLIKNFLTQWETKEENRKISGNVPLINRENSGNVLLINRELAILGDGSECASLLKLTELMKKPSNLIKTEKEKLHRPISYFLTRFVELIRRICFCFAENLMGLTDSLAIGRAKLRGRKVAIGFSR